MAEGPTSGWQKVGVLSGALAAVLIPVVIALVGSWTSTALKDQEIRGQFVQLAVSILQEPPTPENRSVREWAIRVINQYSNVPLETAAAEALTDSAALPLPSVGRASGGADPASAAALEREAFGALIGGDVNAAIAGFEAAEAAYPSYHSVYEIARYLRGVQGDFEDAQGRREVYRTVVERYSWGVPADIIERLRTMASP